MSALETIKKALAASGGEHLGDMVFWTLAEARVDLGRLEALWSDAGLDPSTLPEPPTAERALKLAARACQVGQFDRLIRLGKEDGDELVFAVVHEHRSREGDLTYSQEARVRLDRATEVLTGDPPEHELATAIKTSFAVLRSTYSPDDVRKAIVRTLHALSAITLRDGGGVYWVPGPFAGTVRQLQRAVEKIGSSRFYLLPVHRSAEAERTLGEIAKGAIEEELSVLKVEIEGFLQAPPERASTLLRRFDAFEALRTKARLYRDVLAVEVKSLDEQLDKLSAAVERLLAAKQAPLFAEVGRAAG